MNLTKEQIQFEEYVLRMSPLELAKILGELELLVYCPSREALSDLRTFLRTVDTTGADA